jgi:Raf kinase inhibitor-like YbhB/YbcL family protein
MIVESIFEYQAPIPLKYTCQGENISPPLKFSAVPKNTKSLVLFVDDPDAPGGTFDHWIVWNIPPNTTKLSEGATELFVEGSQVKEGTNGFGDSNYGGPCPPPGRSHRYFFKLFALDSILDLEAGSLKHSVEIAMDGHVLERAEWMGTYQKS